eukprot:gb/GEZN01005212.1/.p1 GENE.gb/GEZN01005212.1/~~gb/GEZN01005212.1/.p1  ORF type:complete len:463 (-),score=64.39 gb/GEZN01005212.1/:395-1783(-)
MACSPTSVSEQDEESNPLLVSNLVSGDDEIVRSHSSYPVLLEPASTPGAVSPSLSPQHNRSYLETSSRRGSNYVLRRSSLFCVTGLLILILFSLMIKVMGWVPTALSGHLPSAIQTADGSFHGVAIGQAPNYKQPAKNQATEGKDGKPHVDLKHEVVAGLGTFAGGSTKQFLHMHHMKTGGTSLDTYLQCAVARGSRLINENVSYGKLSECAGEVDECLEAMNNTELDNICEANTSAVMSLCTSLYNVRRLGWGAVPKVTVIRDAVDRVWSMYRFETSDCYNCVPLLEIYQRIDNGTLDEVCGGNHPGCRGVCVPQLVNHMATNLRHQAPPSLNELLNIDENAYAAEAISNLNNEFEVVALTEELQLSLQIMASKFPWLGNALQVQDEEPTVVEHANLNCSLTFANKSPKINKCAALPHAPLLSPKPDQATVAAIIAHNGADILVREEALRLFAIQKEVFLG